MKPDLCLNTYTLTPPFLFRRARLVPRSKMFQRSKMFLWPPYLAMIVMMSDGNLFLQLLNQCDAITPVWFWFGVLL